jgi:hypothetical protein
MCPSCVCEASSDEATPLGPRSPLVCAAESTAPSLVQDFTAALAKRESEGEDKDLDRVAVSVIIRTQRG